MGIKNEFVLYPPLGDAVAFPEGELGPFCKFFAAAAAAQTHKGQAAVIRKTNLFAVGAFKV